MAASLQKQAKTAAHEMPWSMAKHPRGKLNFKIFIENHINNMTTTLFYFIPIFGAMHPREHQERN